MWILSSLGLLTLGLSCAEGATDEGADADGDGYGEFVDCDDTDPNRHPNQPEICDGIDNDCDGNVDDGDVVGAPKFWIDEDGDGYGTDMATVQQCAKPAGYADVNGDCNDADPAIHPGAEEDCTVDADQNCDGSVGFADADMDGVPACMDCDDTEASVNSGAPEICDGLDNDCDMEIDEDAPEVMCGTIENGALACSDGECVLGSCDMDYYDVNADQTDGCECLADPTPVGAGASCATAIDLGNFTDVIQDTSTLTGNDAAGSREIWYVFTAVDDVDTAGDEFHVDIRFLTNPSDGYQLDVYRNGCPGGSGDELAVGEIDMVDWYTDQNFTSANCGGVAPCGEGNCVPTLGAPAANQCNDDTATFFVKISRVDGAASCDGYELEISNGLY